MPIPSQIRALIDRLNQELDEIEQEIVQGLTQVRQVISLFGDNPILIKFFSTLNNALLFVEISRRRVQITVNRIVPVNVTVEEIQEAGEDLGTELGRVLEVKVLGVLSIVWRTYREATT